MAALPGEAVDRAIAIAQRAGIELKIAAKVDAVDKEYFDTEIRHLLHDPRVDFIGEIGLLIALELQHIVEQLGGTVVGPAGSVEDALQLLSETTPDAALLDVNLREGRVTPVAQACRDRCVPFALVTGYGRLELDEPLLQSAPRAHKPFDRRAIHKVLDYRAEKGS